MNTNSYLSIQPSYCFFDEEKFKDLTCGYDEVMIETAEAFVKYTPVMVEDLMQSVLAHDRERTKYAIHKLKSSTTLLASQAVVLDITDLEKSAELVSMQALTSSAFCVKEVILRLLDEVDQFLKNQFVLKAA